jgi:hypothetical protein
MQGGEKLPAVQIVLENILAAISPIDNVVNRSRILHAQFARHGTILPQTQKVSIVRTDTCTVNPSGNEQTKKAPPAGLVLGLIPPVPKQLARLAMKASHAAMSVPTLARKRLADLWPSCGASWVIAVRRLWRQMGDDVAASVAKAVAKFP